MTVTGAHERALYYYDYVTMRAEDVVDLLHHDGGSILQEATGSAAHSTGAVVAQLSVNVAGFAIGRDAEVKMGDMVVEGNRSLLPLTWHALTHPALFPSMSGMIEVERLSDAPPLAQLGFIGRYEPPLGTFGSVADAILGHQLAEAAIRSFVSDLTSLLNRLRPLAESSK